MIPAQGRVSFNVIKLHALPFFRADFGDYVYAILVAMLILRMERICRQAEEVMAICRMKKWKTPAAHANMMNMLREARQPIREKWGAIGSSPCEL